MNKFREGKTRGNVKIYNPDTTAPKRPPPPITKIKDHTPFNKLTSAQSELLALLSEELGEAVQAIGKILRHGYESRHPFNTTTNREDLEKELGDITCAIKLIVDSGDLDFDKILEHADNKLVRVTKYLHHNND